MALSPFAYPAQTQKYKDLGYSGVAVSTGGEAPKGKTLIGTEYLEAVPYRRNFPGRPAQTLYIYGDAPQPQQQAAPAPAGSNNKAQLTELTAASKNYKKQAEALIAEGKKKIATLEDEQLKAEKAQQLQAQLAIQSAVSKNLGQMAPAVKGAPSSKMQIGGTQKFKTAPKQFYLPQIQTASGLNVPTANTLNI